MLNAIRNADAIVMLDWLGPGNTINLAFTPGAERPPIIKISNDLHIRRGWNMNFGVLPAVDVNISRQQLKRPFQHFSTNLEPQTQSSCSGNFLLSLLSRPRKTPPNPLIQIISGKPDMVKKLPKPDVFPVSSLLAEKIQAKTFPQAAGNRSPSAHPPEGVSAPHLCPRKEYAKRPVYGDNIT